MLVKHLGRTLSLAVFMQVLCYADQAYDLYAKYWDTVHGDNYPDKCDLSWITPEVREVIIRKAKDVFEHPNLNDTNPRNNSGAEQLLIELEDMPIIEAHIAEWRKGKTAVWRVPALIPYIMEDVEHGATAIRGGGHVFISSVMHDATADIYRMLESYPCFPPETRLWARRIRNTVFIGDGPDNDGNKLIRSWWDRNKNAILAHKYGEAKWLPTKTGNGNETTEYLPNPDDARKIWPPGSRKPVIGVSPKDPSAPAATVAGEFSNKGTGLFVFLGIATAAVCSGAWLFLRFRKRMERPKSE